MEARLSFPRHLYAFDLFHPSSWRLVSDELPSSNRDKAKTDSYLLVPDPRINLKFGDSGKAFDLKYQYGGGGSEEMWVSVAKGQLDAGREGDSTNLVEKLRALQSSSDVDKDSPKSQGLDLALKLLSDIDPSSISEVVTVKRLLTTELTGPQRPFVAEQIEFDAYPKGRPEKVQWRSVSLEKAVPPGTYERVKAAIEAKHAKDLVVEGGFPHLVRTICEHHFMG